jgi:glyoxylase-like metal-dependent hydrolase (beta-lactamase superfamily II)
MSAQDCITWQVGNVTIARIVEVANYPDPISILLKDADPGIFEPYASWLQPHFVTPAGEMLIQWQAFAIRTPTRTIMIDTCIGNDRTRHFHIFNNLQTPFLADLAACGVQPKDVDVVCCTHLHYDHVGWNTQLIDGAWRPTFPNAVYLFDNTEYAEIRHMQKEGDWHGQHLPDAIDPIIAAGLHRFIDAPGYRVCDEVWFEHTPGHTAGHCAVHIESEGEHAVITGDLIHHPVQIALPGWHGNFDHDPESAIATRQRFVANNSGQPTMVIGSHFAGPTAGWIVPDGQHNRFTLQRPAT